MSKRQRVFFKEMELSVLLGKNRIAKLPFALPVKKTYELSSKAHYAL